MKKYYTQIYSNTLLVHKRVSETYARSFSDMLQSVRVKPLHLTYDKILPDIITCSLHLQILRNSYFGAHVSALELRDKINFIFLISVLHTGQMTLPSVVSSCASFAVNDFPLAIASSLFIRTNFMYPDEMSSSFLFVKPALYFSIFF